MKFIFGIMNFACAVPFFIVPYLLFHYVITYSTTNSSSYCSVSTFLSGMFFTFMLINFTDNLDWYDIFYSTNMLSSKQLRIVLSRKKPPYTIRYTGKHRYSFRSNHADL